MRKRKIDDRQMSFDFDAVSVEHDAVEAGRAAIEAYDAAARRRDLGAQREAVLAFQEAVTGNRERFLFEYAEELHARLGTSPGEAPLFGQAFEGIIDAAGIRVRIRYEGIALMGLLSVYAVDDEPFISETGYQSLRTGRIIDPEGLEPLAFYSALVTSSAWDQKKDAIVLKPLKAGWRRGAWIGTEKVAA